MCGIVGAVAERDITLILVEGLKRLEYRGYDSAGVAILNNEIINRKRIKGKVGELADLIHKEPIMGTTGIAHTRWATHGVPSELNAHPHISNNTVALVHNGIIENYEHLREQLREIGYEFASETDSEVAAHLLHHYLKNDKNIISAIKNTVADLHGAFAIGIIHQNDPGRILAVRSGSPLVVGLGMGENFIASDSLALLPVTNKFIYLEEGDIADITRDKVTIYNSKGEIVEREIHQVRINTDVADKGRFRHYMEKEIFEQPKAIADTIESRLGKDQVLEETFGIKAKAVFDKTERVTIIACGTSYHAGLIARYWLEEFAQVPCAVEIASEYRYRRNVVSPNTLFVAISQSGETADTLAALRLAKTQGYLSSLAVCNVPESSLVREAELIFMTRAGIEIGVASTKAFTTQLAALFMLTLVLGRRHGMSAEQEATLVQQLKTLPRKIEEILTINSKISQLAKLFADKEHALFLGRGSQYPVALEGALKLKEISYIHAEAYPAGELKHGPLALVDNDMPVIAVAPNNSLLDKLKSNLEEVQARGGRLIVFADEATHLKSNHHIELIETPAVDNAIAPIVYTIPLQLLAYHVAIIKGTDVDQPRNLAKSVTVE